MLDEIYYLCKHLHMSYSDLMKMPTYERKYFINKLSEDFQKRNEEYERTKNKR